MIWEVVLLFVLLIWIIVYIKNKKAILALPYLLIGFSTPFYNMLDSRVFIKVFGCGCVPSVQTNMFNIDFNANDLRIFVYNILAILMLILGIKLSKRFESKKAKIIYNVTIIIFNTLLSTFICKSYMWN